MAGAGQLAGVLEASGADLTPDRYGGITIDLSAGNEGAARGLADAMEVRQQHGPAQHDRMIDRLAVSCTRPRRDT